MSSTLCHANACPSKPKQARSYGTAFELDLELACCKNQPKPSPDPPQTLPKPTSNPPKSAPRAPKSVQKRPRASQSAQQASQGRPKSAQERPSAARILSKISLNGARIATNTNFYEFLSLSFFNSNSLLIFLRFFKYFSCLQPLILSVFSRENAIFHQIAIFEALQKNHQKSPKKLPKIPPQTLPKPEKIAPKPPKSISKMQEDKRCEKK